MHLSPFIKNHSSVNGCITMRLKINSKKTSKKVCDKFACTEKSRTFAPAFGKEARRRAGRRIKNLPKIWRRAKSSLSLQAVSPFFGGMRYLKCFGWTREAVYNGKTACLSNKTSVLSQKRIEKKILYNEEFDPGSG